jgi:hypothetical protein
MDVSARIVVAQAKIIIISTPMAHEVNIHATNDCEIKNQVEYKIRPELKIYQITRQKCSNQVYENG